MIRVLLADDQPLMTAGIALILGSDSEMTVVAQTANGKEAVARTQELLPDVVLMDVQMPEMDGLEACRQIKETIARPPTVLMLTTFAREDYLVQALEAGASGYLLKNAKPEALIDGVRAGARGDGVVAPELTGSLIRRAFKSSPTATSAPGYVDVRPVDQLTQREVEILTLVAAGLSNQEIADQLFLGVATVKTHVSSVLMKLGVRDRVQAVVWAHRNGIVHS